MQLTIEQRIKTIEKGLIASCPKCKSPQVRHRTKLGGWRCNDCGHECDEPLYRKPVHAGRRGAWNAAELAYLRATYGKGVLSAEQIAEHLGRSVNGVYMRAKYEGLAKVRGAKANV